MPFTSEITCVWGRRGSGKTTLAKKLIAQHKPPQLVVLDPLAHDGVTPQEMAQRILANERMTVVTGGREEMVGALLLACTFSTPQEPIYALCDEAPAYLAQPSEALHKLVYQGRHAGFGMCIVGQRPAAVHASIRSQAATTYWMALSDHVDVQTAHASIGADAKTLPGLAAGQFIKWPR